MKSYIISAFALLVCLSLGCIKVDRPVSERIGDLHDGGRYVLKIPQVKGQAFYFFIASENKMNSEWTGKFRFSSKNEKYEFSLSEENIKESNFFEGNKSKRKCYVIEGINLSASFLESPVTIEYFSESTLGSASLWIVYIPK